MVGLCGVLGSDAELTDEVVGTVRRHDDEVTVAYDDERVELRVSSHPLLAGDQPATADGGDVLVWVWGDVYGYGSGDAYAPRPGPSGGSAEFCARRYEEDGPDFVSGLNGEFALVLYDRVDDTISFVTDRLATKPVYWIRPESETVVFASNLNALPHHPAVDVEYDLDYLQEYLALRRVFGVETPLAGVRERPPASVTTVDVDDLTTETTTYWRPRYDPVEQSFSAVVDDLTETLKRVLAEWTDDDLTYGLLLSGGSDSRFVEACIDQSVVALHTTDWTSRETRVARRVAEAAGDDFRLLIRNEDHEARALEATAGLTEYSGWFDQAYFTPFEDRIRDEVDVLVSGLFADTLFSAASLPRRRVSLGPLGKLTLPFERPIHDLEDYVDTKLLESPPLPYFTPERSMREVLSANLHRTPDGGVVSHGVGYDSLTDLAMYGDYYPLGADTEALFPRSLAQIRPTRSPFLDNRLLDLQQRIPRRYFLRRNLINAGVSRVAPELAKIPHAGTGVPLTYSYPLEYVGTNLVAFYRKHIGDDPTPAPHLDHGPWPNRRELLRTRPFAADTVAGAEPVVRRLPFLDYDAVERTLRTHREGEDNTVALYSLLTLLWMPHLEMATRQGSIDGHGGSDGSGGGGGADGSGDVDGDGSGGVDGDGSGRTLRPAGSPPRDGPN
ncbi:asparagine synthase-related protein [Halobium salinum]|uniref:Asparagine synthase-related protein n=1 Tax=Halobium salinum TaxID=1364940 RepID=A0ABD5PBA0_9EURY|nr:asparagine synthase-related protein [Halobium salinum]